jgi:hypothetical protein
MAPIGDFGIRIIEGLPKKRVCDQASPLPVHCSVLARELGCRVWGVVCSGLSKGVHCSVLAGQSLEGKKENC